MPPQAPEPLRRADDMRNRDRGDGELHVELDREDGRQHAADAESDDRGQRAGDRAGRREQNQEHMSHRS